MRDRSRTYNALLGAVSTRLGGDTAGVRPRAGAVPVFSLFFLFLQSFLFILLFSSFAWSATPTGTVISNTATANYTPGAAGGPVTVSSNIVSVTTTVRRTIATIEYLQYAPTATGSQPVTVQPTAYSPSGNLTGPFTPVGAPVPAGSTTPIDLTQPVPLVPPTQYHTGEPIFIRLTDGDQNNDPALAETVVVTIRDDKTGDTETLRLTETGPNTGVFAGYVQSTSDPVAVNNGFLSLVNDSRVIVSYVDAGDSTDTHTVVMLVDPYGIVFNSATGQPVNGAIVTLVDAATGGPAVVYGDDGVATFPASLTTGGTAADSAGRVYTLSPGGYRFPFIKPGRYRLDIQPPVGYRAPSSVSTAVLQALPGGPFAMVDPGSRGEEFIVNPGPAIHIDVPVDPVGARLYLLKSAVKQTASIGDLVPYKLTVENVDTIAPVQAVTVVDRLPNGFRYRKRSARLNSGPAAEPVISEDGRSVTFTIGDLAAAAKADITYVVEVGAGAELGKAVNTAEARGSLGAASNVATASVLVTEDLFRSKTTIIGRVLDGCDGERGIGGVRIFLENGTYVVTDRNGMYHFEGVDPGTHVVQLDAVTIPETHELRNCEENTRFAGTAFSQFTDLQGGSLWRADFHLGQKPKITGEVGLELRSSLVTDQAGTPKTDPGSQYGIAYAVPLHVGNVPVRKLRIIVMLPDGVSYQPGSGRVNDAAASDPEIADGVLTFHLGDEPADWESTVRFNASAPAAGPAGELTTKAFLIFDTTETKGQKTPVADVSLVRHTLQDQKAAPDVVLRPRFATLNADLSGIDRKEIEKVIGQLKALNINRITVTGHTDSHAIREGASKEFPDNYALSRGRAQTVARVIAAALNLSSDQITIIGKGPDEPVATNTTAKGRALNRRVELKVEARHETVWTEIKSVKESSGMKTVATAGLQAGEARAPESQTRTADDKTMPDYDVTWIETAQPGSSWLWPAEGHHPNIASTRIAVKHDPRLKLKLFLNNSEVDTVYYEGMIKKSDGAVAVSFWRGIHLAEGDNQFTLLLLDAAGSEVEQLRRTMHYSGPPVKAVLLPERSRLVADGKNPVVLAVRLLDKDGHPAREGVRADYFLDPPYVSKQRADELQKSPLTAPDTDRLRYLIGEDGVTLIELMPTTRTGEAVLRLQLAEGFQEVRTWLKPEDRDWILVGLAEGTAGYNVVKGNMETTAASGVDDKFYENDRLAFYAKGRIKGEWLLTLAYDSAKASNNGRQGLYQAIDPNKYYTLYGDATQQGYDAESAKRIYVKLERDQFYALFGDYATGLSVTELSRYNRNFTGFKSELKTGRFEYNVFLSDTNQAYVRDEIRGDGTSGLYHLSRKNIVLNSETVTIETRDRFRSEVIVSTRRLVRSLDYTIDYESGTLFFKAPVYSRDGNFNPVFIVAEYESFDAADTAYNYGGRGAARLLDNRVEIGATHIHEGGVGGSGNLEGVDAKVTIGGGSTLRAEVATTKTDQAGTAKEGAAYLAEIQHRSETLEGKAYVREQETGFGLGQQNGSETGVRKAGADLNYRISKPVTVGAEVFEQDNLSTGAVRDMAEVRGRYTTGPYDLLAGLRHAEDALGSGETRRSDQMFAGMQYRMNERVSVRLRHDQSVGQNNNIDFPTRTAIGADYKINDASTLFTDQEWTKGAALDTETSRIGIRTSPWTGGQIGSTLEQQTTESGVRLFSTTGLKQTWQLTKQWSVDGGLDRTKTVRSTGSYAFNTNVPSASGGTEDFTAVSFGVGYHREKWSWTTRVEKRIADSEDKLGVFAGANGEVRSGLALAAGLQFFRSAAATGLEKQNSDVRLSLAYRPDTTDVVILDRLDYLLAEQRGGSATYDNNRRVINNLVTNIKTDNTTQVSVQYASKYVRETIDQSDYHGYTDLVGLEGRYDITKKWDAGVRGLRLRSWGLHQERYGAGASIGFNAGRNIWISLGYNFSGFKDRDFSRADFTSEGPFIKLRMKFDQVSVRDAVKWFSGQ